MKDIDYIQSNLKPRSYSPSEVVRLINMKQAKLYISNKIYPIDIYTSIDKKGESVLVMVFLNISLIISASSCSLYLIL